MKTAHDRDGDLQRALRIVQNERLDPDAQIRDPPGRDQVAEVDQARWHPAARVIAHRDHVVIGDISMHGMDRQVCGDRRQQRLGETHSAQRLGAPALVRHMVNERIDNMPGAAEVPLDRAIEAGVLKRCHRPHRLACEQPERAKSPL